MNKQKVCTVPCTAPLSVAVSGGSHTLCKAPCAHTLPNGECGTTCGDYYEYGDLCVERCPSGFPYAADEVDARSQAANGTTVRRTITRKVCNATCTKYVVEDNSSVQTLFCSDSCGNGRYRRNVGGQTYCVESCGDDFMFRSIGSEYV